MVLGFYYRFEFLIFIIIFALFYGFVLLARSGRFVPDIRPFPALEAIPEGVGRAAELGKPVVFNSGIGAISDHHAPQTMAALTISGRVAEESAKLGVFMKYICACEQVLPSAQDIVRAGYVKAGRPDLFDPSMVEFVYSQKPFMARTMDYIEREKPAVSFMFGATFWETMNVQGAAAIAGSMQIGGTGRLYYQWSYLAMSDYVLLAEELYAASAAIEGSPPNLGCIAGQDYAKAVAIALLVLSAILITAGTGLWDKIISI